MVHVYAGSDPFPDEPDSGLHQVLIRMQKERILESMFAANAAEHANAAVANATNAANAAEHANAAANWANV